MPQVKKKKHLHNHTETFLCIYSELVTWNWDVLESRGHFIPRRQLDFNPQSDTMCNDSLLTTADVLQMKCSVMFMLTLTGHDV